MNDNAALYELLIQHETTQMADQLAYIVQKEVVWLIQQSGRSQQLSQVRSLANALAPHGAGDHPQLRLARLHELVARQLQRLDAAMPVPLTALTHQTEALPSSFWSYVGARLLGLYTGDEQPCGLAEQVWQKARARYGQGLTWPSTLPASWLATIHLQLAESFIHQLIETWEYTERELA